MRRVTLGADHGLVPSLSSEEGRNLRRLSRMQTYQPPGSKQKYPIVARVFLYDRQQRPRVLILCKCGARQKARFEYVVFSDSLHDGAYPSDSFGYGTEKQALQALRDYAAYEILGIWPWVVCDVLKAVRTALPVGQRKGSTDAQTE